MKKILLLSVLGLFISCANQNQECETVSNGFTSTEGEQVTMGSQETVDIFLKIDKAWNDRDYDAIRSLVSEDAQLMNEKGEILVGAQAFADYIEKDYKIYLPVKLREKRNGRGRPFALCTLALMRFCSTEISYCSH